MNETLSKRIEYLLKLCEGNLEVLNEIGDDEIFHASGSNVDYSTSAYEL